MCSCLAVLLLLNSSAWHVAKCLIPKWGSVICYYCQHNGEMAFIRPWVKLFSDSWLLPSAFLCQHDNSDTGAIFSGFCHPWEHEEIHHVGGVHCMGTQHVIVRAGGQACTCPPGV